jgi:hypothetical protein
MPHPYIVTFASLTPRAPEHMKYAAAMVSTGKPGTHWLSTGRTPEEAEQKLLDMWRRQFPPPSRRGKNLRKKSEPAPETLDDLDVVL